MRLPCMLCRRNAATKLPPEENYVQPDDSAALEAMGLPAAFGSSKVSYETEQHGYLDLT